MPTSRRTRTLRIPTGDGAVSGRPARFASFVLDDLTTRIVRGDFPPGTVLPTEPALCREFGFSRTVIREALKLLEERSLVRVEQGRGTTVQPRESWNLLDPVVLNAALSCDPDRSLLDDLVGIRKLLEREMTRSAAAWLTADELDALGENLDTMATVFGDYDRFRDLDKAFHAIVMRASASPIGYTIVRAIHRYGGSQPPLASGAPRESLERTLEQHRAIYEALRARDGDLAADRVAAHIDSGWAERRSIA